jgi:hypothetical protein
VRVSARESQRTKDVVPAATNGSRPGRVVDAQLLPGVTAIVSCRSQVTVTPLTSDYAVYPYWVEIEALAYPLRTPIRGWGLSATEGHEHAMARSTANANFFRRLVLAAIATGRLLVLTAALTWAGGARTRDQRIMRASHLIRWKLTRGCRGLTEFTGNRASSSAFDCRQ